MWIFLLNTGCRIEELLTLTFLQIPPPTQLTKTKKELYVPLFTDAKNSLEYLMQQSNDDKAISLTYTQIIYNLKKYSKLANINPKITPHTYLATKGDLPFLKGSP